jgi:hypothetical protein
MDMEGKVVEELEMPADDSNDTLDITLIRNWLLQHKSTIRRIYLEKTGGVYGQNGFNGFKMGRNFGIVEGIILAMFGRSLIKMIRPQEWQKVVWPGDMVKENHSRPKDQRDSGKMMTFRTFNVLYPSLVESYRLPTKRGKPSVNFHDGRIDALLIAEAGRRLELATLNVTEEGINGNRLSEIDN